MKKQIRRMSMLLFLVLTVGTLSVPAFANAREITETDPSQPVAEQASESESEDSQSAETPPANPVEEIAGTGASEETAGSSAEQDVTAPKGNLTMVEEVIDTNGARKQFVTLATKNGNFFYLIIDRDEKGNNNVYFLNQVDERDLFSLMDDKETAELREELALGEDTGQPEAALPIDTQTETEDKNPLPKTGVLMMILLLLAIVGGSTAFFFLKQKKAKTARVMSPDPDADYEEEDEDDSDDPDGDEGNDYGVTEQEENEEETSN